MGSWWRSEDMTYVSLVISEDVAPTCIKELGNLGCFQFTDLNPDLTPFQRRYVSYVRRCDEIERKIRFLAEETKRMNIKITPTEGTIDSFLDKAIEKDAGSSGAFIIESLETKLSTYESKLLQLIQFSSKLAVEYAQKVEYHHIMTKTLDYLNRQDGKASALSSAHSHSQHTAKKSKRTASKRNADDDDDGIEAGVVMSPLIKGLAAKNDLEIQVSHIAGCIALTEKDRFERMLHRATRGNIYIKFAPLSLKAVDADNNYIGKIAFLIFFKSDSVDAKIKKLCDAFNANIYILGALNAKELKKRIDENSTELTLCKEIVDRNKEAKLQLLEEVSTSLEEWLWITRREKNTYHTLNLFKADVAGHSVLRARAWALTSSADTVQRVISKAHEAMNVPNTAVLSKVKNPHSWPVPPTHFHTNKYTTAFQSFVNTYGIPRYKEANPALFTAATFPFLFGVMYGDIGHGSCLALAGLYLILTEKQAESRETGGMLKDIYVARYMLFAMGIMGVYCGLVYNDYFSIGLDLFGSRFFWSSTDPLLNSGMPAKLMGAYGDEMNVYPFGVDPVWHLATNELLFYNSMKMKMSVVLGIFQMTFGIILRGLNSFYFKSWLDFVTEFMPMIIFDVSLFGYMVVLIFVKWAIDWNQRMALGTCSYNQSGVIGACNLATQEYCYSVTGMQCDATTLLSDICPLQYGGTGGGCQPPNLITTLINIALSPGAVIEPMFAGQAALQTLILLVAFLCVPWLLCAKPLYLKFTHKPTPVKHSAPITPIKGSSKKKKHHDASPVSEDEEDEDAVESQRTKKGKKKDKKKSRKSKSPSPERKAVAVVVNPLHDDDEEEEEHAHGGGHNAHGGHGGEFNFGEIFIHQAIETIEFVLGMVSNTASYLRLWALSLAHTELATVFWEKAMISGINTGNPVFIFVAYAVFACVTFGVLLAMDVLECFLHALRLHWVEFQNKFYKADGYAFTPFDFKAVLATSTLE